MTKRKSKDLKKKKPPLLRAKSSNSAALVPPLTLPDLLKVVRPWAKEFSEACNVPPSYTSKSWWMAAIARMLGDAGLSVVMDLTKKNFRNHLGNFYLTVDKDFSEGVDFLACEDWSRHEIESEDYGTDKPYLPSFHAVKVLTNQMSEWGSFFDVGLTTKSPLTATLVVINVFGGGEGYWHAANNFKRDMKELKADYNISSSELNPGILASVTTFLGPADPFQVLAAHKIWNRPPIQNPEFKPMRSGRLRRS
jgi:hypothetical protein